MKQPTPKRPFEYRFRAMAKQSPNIKSSGPKRPFELDHFLSAVNNASERSRNIFLIIIFSSLLILMAIVNALKPEWSWYGSRFQLKKDIATFIIFPEENSAALGDSIGGQFYPYCKSIQEYVVLNEVASEVPDTCKCVLDSLNFKTMHLRKGYYIANPSLAMVKGKSCADRFEKYNAIVVAYNFAADKNLRDKAALKSDLNELLEAQLEHINLVRVPFLGISFDVNLLGFYGGLTLAGLYLLLYFSFVREHRNLKILFRRAWVDDRFHNYYFYEFVSMHQVLSVPKKLFESNKRNESLLRNMPFIGLIVPGLIQFLVVMYDWHSYQIGLETNPFLTKISFWVSATLLLPIFYLIYKISTRLNRIDSLWDAQSIQYNLEFILENLGEDLVLDFNEFEKKLNPNDLGNVKKYWHSLIHQAANMGPVLYEKDARSILDTFIKGCFNKSYLDNQFPSDAESTKMADKAWFDFKTWFEQKGKKKIDYRFYISFTEDYLMLKSGRKRWYIF